MNKFLLLVAALLLSACVTINIYFPAAAAEKAADEIIKGIQEHSPVKKPEPKASLPVWQARFYQSLAGTVNWLIPSAQAADADLDIDSADIRKLQASMKTRFATLEAFYQQGFIGIKQDGSIGIRDAASIPLKNRNEVSKLVSAENSDREDLYHAIANANGHPEWAEQIKATFAARWLTHVQAGWWYEVSSNNWKQK
jgi:hypothetical protein